jgi:hypothetical protein
MYSMDWDKFYFEYWVDHHPPGVEPTMEDYQEWLFEAADRALRE